MCLIRPGSPGDSPSIRQTRLTDKTNHQEQVLESTRLKVKQQTNRLKCLALQHNMANREERRHNKWKGKHTRSNRCKQTMEWGLHKDVLKHKTNTEMLKQHKAEGCLGRILNKQLNITKIKLNYLFMPQYIQQRT